MKLPTELPNCFLRPWSSDDNASLLRHANNRKIWRNLTDLFPHPYTEADADSWLEIASRPGRSIHLAIEFQAEAIGGIGISAGEGISRYTGQFGYWVGEALWGKKIATAAARSMAEHVFATTDFQRLEAPIFAWNPASMRVAEKAGFTREAVLTQGAFKDGELVDVVLYARLRDKPTTNSNWLTSDPPDNSSPYVL